MSWYFFFDASKHLYERLRSSVRPSVCPSVMLMLKSVEMAKIASNQLQIFQKILFMLFQWSSSSIGPSIRSSVTFQNFWTHRCPTKNCISLTDDQIWFVKKLSLCPSRLLSVKCGFEFSYAMPCDGSSSQVSLRCEIYVPLIGSFWSMIFFHKWVSQLVQLP